MIFPISERRYRIRGPEKFARAHFSIRSKSFNSYKLECELTHPSPVNHAKMGVYQIQKNEKSTRWAFVNMKK